MGFVEEALERANRPIAPLRLGAGGQRAFQPGAAGIASDTLYWGVDTQKYVPMEYADYASKSNPVYSIIQQKAMYLSMLPFRIYRFGQDIDERRGARVEGLADASGEYLTRLLSMLDEKVGKVPTAGSVVAEGRSRAYEARNAIVAMSQMHKREELATFRRMMALEEIKSGALFDLLRYVNPHWSLNRFLVMTHISLSLYGQAVWFAERGASGMESPRELWWADPRRVRPIPHPTAYLMGYEYDPIDGGEPIPYRVGEVVRIYYPHPDDQFQPLSPLAAARIYADHEQASIQGNMNFHRQGLNPGAVLTPKGRIQWNGEQAKKVEEDINRRMRGVDRSHRWAVFRHEVEIHRNGFSPSEASFVEGMEYDIQRVANAFQWPIDLLAGRRTYENVNQAQKIAWTTITAEGAYIAAEVTEQLLPMFRRTAADFFAFDTSDVAVLQDSEAERWEREKDQVDKVITRNEYRAARGMPPVEGGDRLWISDQMIPLDSEYTEMPATIAKSMALQGLNGAPEAPVEELEGEESSIEIEEAV